MAAPVVAAAAAAVAVSLSADTTVASNAAPTIPTPQSAFGFTPCQDYKLANYTQISSYFHQLDNASDRMQVVSLGQTSEGRDQVMGIVSAPENLSPANLAKYQDIANRLAHARDLTDDQAHDLAKQGKAIAWVDFGIHSTEVGPPQTAPQFAYDLLTSNTPETKSILKNVITLFVPNINPDGGEHIPDWYMKYVGTQFQDSSLSRALPEVLRARRQPRLVHVQPARDAEPGQRPVALVVSAAGLQHAPDRGLSGAHLPAAVQGPDEPEHPA